MADFQFPPRASQFLDEKGLVTVPWLEWFTQVAQRLTLVQVGLGDPTGVVAAPVGALFLRLDGGAATTLYVKEALGAAPFTAGWVAK